MLVETVSSLDQALAHLSRAVESVRVAVACAHGSVAWDAIHGALRAADAFTATAVELVGRGGFDTAAGLPAEMMLRLGARRTASDARMISQASGALSTMPSTASAFDEGRLSWGEVRAIVCATRTCDAAGRTAVDGEVRRLTSVGADPDELIAAVDDIVARRRHDLAVAREDRIVERRFLSVQGRLDGSASLYGEGDAESVATIMNALDSMADAPVSRDDPEAPSRAAQRFDALVALCETSLSGGSVGRPRARLLATVDVRGIDEAGLAESARVLWALAGRPARLSRVATDTLACDAEVLPVVFDGGQPIATGDAASPVRGRVRTALIARDGGCRFPSCGAPASWCDAHHIRPRSSGGTSDIDNLLLLCRRCHRRIHRHRWRISLRDDGRIEFAHRGRAHTSAPRARPAMRE